MPFECLQISILLLKQILVQAIVKEVERMHNPFWLGTPHVASEDFLYNGQYIPKDTVLVLNTYSMHHDPERHPEPFKFDVSFHTVPSEDHRLNNPA